MRITVFGLITGTVVSFVLWSVVGQGLPAAAQGSVYQPSGELIALSMSIQQDRHPAQQVTVIDPRTRVMSIYHVEAKSGMITLKSVRNIDFDLKMTEYNAASPLPSEIRATIERR